MNKFLSIASGINHLLCLSAEGTVYGYGSNLHGQLGLPIQNKSVNSLTKIPNLSDIAQIAAQSNHSLFLKSDGTVYGCGSAAFRVLHPLFRGNIYTPTELPDTSDIKYIATYTDRSLFLTKDDIVIIHGMFRESRRVIHMKDVVSIHPSISFTLFLHADGNVSGVGNNMKNLMMDNILFSVKDSTLIPEPRNIISIVLSPSICYFLKADGTVEFKVIMTDKIPGLQPLRKLSFKDIISIFGSNNNLYLLNREGILLDQYGVSIATDVLMVTGIDVYTLILLYTDGTIKEKSLI